MALCNLWPAEVVSETLLLSLSINHSLRVFKHDHLKLVQSQAVQALIKGQDLFLIVPAGCGKSLIYQVLRAYAALIWKGLRPRKVTVSVQVI